MANTSQFGLSNPAELLASLRAAWQASDPVVKLVVKAKLRGMERRAHRLERDSNNECPAGSAKCT